MIARMNVMGKSSFSVLGMAAHGSRLLGLLLAG